MGDPRFYRPTKIEVLDAVHPGLKNFVNEQLEKWTSLTDIAEALKELYDEDVNVQVISNYKNIVWWKEQEAEVKARRDARARFAVLDEEKKKDPNGDAAKVIETLVEGAILQQHEKLAEEKPLDLLREMRHWREAAGNFQIEKGKLELDKQRLVNETEELKLKMAQFQRNVEEATDEAKEKLGKGESLTVEDINRIRERTFGLPPIQAGQTTEAQRH